MLFRIVNAVMVALFAVAVAVQYNDPDPVRWMAIYGAALVLCAVAVRRGRVPWLWPVVVGVVALAWGLDVGYYVLDRTAFGHMFDAWEMKSSSIEEAREASGLVIVCGWMAVLAIHARIARRPV